MTRYDGNRALDAEIYFDFVNGELTMDYGKNEYGNPYNSQECIIHNEAWEDEDYNVKEKFRKRDAWYTFLYNIPVVTGLRFLIGIGLVKDTPDVHYKAQQFMRDRDIFTDGIYTQSVSGSQDKPKVVIVIPRNLWFEYLLNGDYKEQIKHISFTRRFVDHKKYGVYPRKVQEGWDVTFEFHQPPKDGSCVVNYV